MSAISVAKYSAVARLLHWLIALSIIAQLVLGLGHEAWRDVFPAMPIHKALGMTVLVLSLLRLFWRFSHPAPALPSSLPGWQAVSARATHWIFYFLIIAVPLTGWIFSSAGTNPLSWFGLFDIPKLPVMKGNPLAEATHEGHEIMGLLFIALIALHIGAALYHHFALKDDVLRRML